jgi:hypothetical protein
LFGAEILRRGIGGTGPKWMEREYEEPVDRDDTHPSVQRGDRGIEVWRLSLQIPFHGHTDPVISGTSPPACAEQYPREISNQEIYYLGIYHKKKEIRGDIVYESGHKPHVREGASRNSVCGRVYGADHD